MVWPPVETSQFESMELSKLAPQDWNQSWKSELEVEAGGAASPEAACQLSHPPGYPPTPSAGQLDSEEGKCCFADGSLGRCALERVYHHLPPVKV